MQQKRKRRIIASLGKPGMQRDALGVVYGKVYYRSGFNASLKILAIGDCIVVVYIFS